MSESKKDYKTLAERWAEDQDGIGFPDEESWEDYAKRMQEEQQSESKKQ